MAKPLFTKKHYEVLGKLVKQKTSWSKDNYIEVIELIEILKKDNPKFSYLKFVKENI